MWFSNRHFWIAYAIVFLSIFSMGSFAAGPETVSIGEGHEVDCRAYDSSKDDDDQLAREELCLFARVESVRRATLFVVPGKDKRKELAIRGKEFYVYIPYETTDDSVSVYLASDPAKTGIKSMAPVVSDDSLGLVELRVTGYYPYSNFTMGTVDGSKTSISLIYNFFVPYIEYSVDGKVVDKSFVSEATVGDKIRVDVRAVIPEGPQKGKTDSTLKKTYYISAEGASENLLFQDGAGKSLKLSDGTIRVEVEKGVGSFWIVAQKAVTDGSTFTMESFKNPADTSKFLAIDKFPGRLTFVNPNMPSLDNAAIFDNDGDGVGDSIAVWFSGNMEPVSVDTFYYRWPEVKEFTKHGGDVDRIDSKTFGLFDVETVAAQSDSVKGALKAYVHNKLESHLDAMMETELKDSIGLVLQSASLLKGNGSTDTLVVRFKKLPDTSWTKGAGLLLFNEPLDVETVKKSGREWSLVVKSGVVSIGDSIRINASIDDPLTARDGVPTSLRNQPVVVKSAGRVYMDPDKNGFFDKDGDGRMDSVVVGFDMAVSKSDLENMTLTFYWLDSKGELLAITPKSEDLVFSDDGMTIGYAVDLESFDVKKMLTAIDKSYSKDGKVSYGYAELSNRITINGKEQLIVDSCAVSDSIAPVVSSTFLNPESFQEMEPDRFRVTFTEPVDRESFTLGDECLEFYVDGSWGHFYDLSDAQWSDDGKTVTFYLEGGDKLTSRMNPADSLRVKNFRDANGNEVSLKTPTVMVKGDPRVVMETTSMADLNRAEELSGRAKPFTIDHVEGELSEEQKASLGVLMDIGFSTIMKSDSAGVLKADMSKIGVKWELFVYTNLGAYVGSTKGFIGCDDEMFDGNCLENPDKLYVRWNMRADNGRKIGVGLYLAKFNIKVFGAEEDFKVERVFRWGVTATHR